MAGPDVGTLSAAVEAVGPGKITVVTGAGVSLASGIPTFRGTDPDAVWKRDVTELGTYRYFREDPVGSWRWYTSRFDGVLDKQADGGTHVRSTAEVGRVLVTKTESKGKANKRIRIELAG